MISGRADAGGARCEGWAYVTDSAKSPDEIGGVWKVSGPRGWEEDRSLQATSFEALPEHLRAPIHEGSTIAKGLAANEQGVLIMRLSEPEVLSDVLAAPEDPVPAGLRSTCNHIATAEGAQKELRSWLQWLLRERIDAQRRRILAQAQVGSALCHLFACAALQQLEEAAETGERKGKKVKVKKGKVAEKSDAAKIVDSKVEAVGQEDLNDCSGSTSAPSSPAPAGQSLDTACDSDGSISTRASSEEPPDSRSATLATGARRLMQEMGWRPEVASEATLDGAEVAAWHEQHPCYRQAISEERQKHKTKFQNWVTIPRDP